MKLFKAFLCTLMLMVASVAVAQSQADKLFQEGQKLMQTMTVASQNAAIKKFQQAKVVYTAADKKTMCDNQIAICNNNKKTISSGSKKKQAEAPAPAPEASCEKCGKKVSECQYGGKHPSHENVELSVSATSLLFKAQAKGKSEVVNVSCNYDDWEVSEKPEWCDVFSSTGKISVLPADNEGELDRSAPIKITCGDKAVEIMVNQKKLSGLGKIKKNVGKKLQNL